jgi:WD repeat-containing protein 55
VLFADKAHFNKHCSDCPSLRVLLFIHRHQYAESGHTQMMDSGHHTASVRSVAFNADGDLLYTGSADKSIAALDAAGAVTWHKQAAHNHAINCVFPMGASLVASGDDQGVVQLWDTRMTDKVMSFSINTDFISDMTCDEPEQHLLATSGDATLSVFDLRTKKLAGRSDDQEDELLSVQIIKNGRKVVCGTQNGVLLLWSWGTWGDCSDRFPGHPHSIDTVVKIDEEALLTGSSDGLIRVVSIQPDKFLGILGDHDEFPVEQIALTHDSKWIGSVTHDNRVRFWDASDLNEDDDDDDADMNDDDNDAADDSKGGSSGGKDIDDSDGDHNDSDDSDDDNDAAGGSGRGGGRKVLATATEKFFADL